jgi:flagellar biosynthesis protein FlhF
MIIKKFQGKTKEDALEAAQKELGDGLVEMNVKTVKAKGILGWLKKTMVEVTVAKEEESEKYERMEAVKQEKQLQPTPKPVPPKDILPEKAPDILKEPQNGLEEKLDNLQNLIEKQLSKQETKQGDEENDEDEEQDSADKGRINFLKLLYTKMTDNEIDEKYAHDIIEEIDKNCKPDMNMDMMLSEIYQRMILKLGKPYVIEESSQGPKVVFFVGPTGVGKTTTIAKIASSYRVERKKKVALLTADTYRIAAAEQLRTYANILEVPFRVVYTSKEIETAIEDFKEYDYILVDTTGHSPNNEAQRESMGSLINSVKTTAPKEVFLVLSASTKYRDLMNIADTYKEIADYKLIFTKVDETSTLGNIYNLKMYTGASLSYITCGQNVPDDIEYFNPQSTVKQLLGGRR